MGVSKNRGTQKWMVHNGKPYQNGRFGGTTIFGNTQISPFWFVSFFTEDHLGCRSAVDHPFIGTLKAVSAQNMSFKTRNSKTNHRRRRLSSGKMCSKYLQCSGMQQLGPRIPARNSSYFHPCCSHENFAPPHHFALGVHGCFQENSSKSRCESWVWRDVFEISLRSVVVVEMFSRHTWLVLFWWIKQDHHCTGYLFA